jgi:hypothetical protein
MEHFAGLDVSVKETSVCIMDDTGRIVREAKVASEPDALLAVLKNRGVLAVEQTRSSAGVSRTKREVPTQIRGKSGDSVHVAFLGSTPMLNSNEPSNRSRNYRRLLRVTSLALRDSHVRTPVRTC